MWSGRGVELLVCLCVTLSCVRVITGDNVYRGDFGISTLGWPGNFATFNTVGGTHGWNQPPNGSFFQEWADKTFTNSSAAIGDVFVFQSNSSISPRTTVTVFATYDQSLNRSSICGDTHLTSYYGTNHFSSDVSLMPLQPNMTYWFLSSGAAGDCSSGMVFSVFIRDRSIDFLRDTYEPPFEREVGVVYTAAYQDTRLSYISNLGPYVPEQPVTVGPNSLNDRRFFYGDGVGKQLALSYCQDCFTHAATFIRLLIEYWS